MKALMNSILLLFSVFFLFQGINAKADLGMDEGFSSPQAVVDAFLSNLRAGSGGVESAVDLFAGEKIRKNDLILEAEKDLEKRPMEKKLKEKLEGDPLVSYRKLGEEVKFGGKMVKMSYELFFKKSQPKNALFVVMQPTMSGSFYLMDVTISGKIDGGDKKD